MFEFLANKWQSLVFRLLFYFLLSMIALALVLAFSFNQRFRPHLEQQVLPNVERYVEYLINDIGHPPDLAVAARLARELPFELRIEGQGVDWRSSPSVKPISRYHFHPAPSAYESVYYGHERRRNLLLVERHGLRYLFVTEDSFRRGSERRHWLLFASLGAILLLLYIGIRRLLQPIGALSDQVRKIGEGDLEQRLAPLGKSELGLLAEGVNRMSQQIRSMLDSKSGLLLAISHELRSPLTRMRVNLELLEDSELQRQLIEDTREMESLLASILESEKLTSGHAPLALKPVQMLDLVEQVIAIHPGRERIQCRLAPVELEVDELRFKLLLKNLVDNALKYSADSARPVEVALRREKNEMVLEVVDQGIGIDADELPKLGEAFYRPDSARGRSTGGYGLGLYLCRLICDAHGGRLGIESEPGKGTRVRVNLPLDNS